MSDKRAPRLPKVQLPVWATFLLIAFGALILYFVTGNQLKKAQNHRLRLLAGLGQGIETLVPELAARFVVVADGRNREAIERYLDHVPSLEYLGCEVLELSETTPPKNLTRRFDVEARGPDVFLRYRVDQTDPGCDEGGSAEASSDRPSVWVTHRARIELDRLLRPILIPDIFDAILVADEEGKIFFQEGVPEVRVSSLDTLLAGARPQQRPAPADSPTGEGPARRYSGSITNVFESYLSDAPHHVFFQPATIRLRLPASLGYFQSTEEAWIVCGIVSRGRLLSSSLATSPVLLFGLVAIFPLAFVAWPFLKLWLISPRQRFTALDVTALVLSSIVGLAILSLGVFAVLFVFNLSREVDEQIEDLSDALYQNLRMELLDAHEQLETLDDAALYDRLPPPEDVEYPGIVSQALARVRKQAEPPFGNFVKLPRAREASDDRANGTGTGNGHDPLRLDLDHYALLHSVFWVDREGNQRKKLPLRRYATLMNSVADREYFRCVGNGEIVLELTAPELKNYAATREVVSPKITDLIQADSPLRQELCVDSVRSKTTAEDLAVVARSSSVPGIHAVALVAELHSVTLPILPSSYAFAIIDGEGEVMFHSDRRRNRTETFLNACDDDPVLASLIDSRRQGHLNLNYLGQPHRAHVRPMAGSPWSLIVLRKSQDLRLRTFELIYDFLNPFGLYLLFLFFLIGLPLSMLPSHHLRCLWPSSEHIYVYRVIVLLTPVVLAGFAVLLETAPYWLVFVVSLAGPAGLVAVYLRLLVAHRELRACFEGRDPSEKETVSGPFFQLFRRMLLREKKNEEGSSENNALRVRGDVPDLFSDYPGMLALVLTGGLISWIAARSSFDGIGFFLALCSLVICGFGIKYRKAFEGEQRRIGYTFAFFCVLFSLSALPAFGFLSLAISRQTQLAVADEQVQLAHELEARWSGLERVDRQLTAHPVRPIAASAKGDRSSELRYATARHAGLCASQKSFLSPFFDTRWIGPEEAPGCEPANGTAERKKVDGGRRPANGESWLNEQGFAARIMASRWISFHDLSFQPPAGIDLSRFELDGHSWTLQGSRLSGTLSQHFNTGDPIRLDSLLPQPLTLRHLRLRTGVLWTVLVVLLISAPWFAAKLITERVLLVKLVPTWKKRQDDREGAEEPAAGSGGRTLEDLYEYLGALAGGSSQEPKDLIAITSVPALAIQPLIKKNAEIAPLPGSAPPAEGRRRSSRRSLLRALFYSPQEEKPGPLVVTPFRPHLHNGEIADRQLSWLADQRKADRPLLIVSRTDPRTVLAEEHEDLQGNGDRPKETLRRRWASFLATFVVRYVLDAGRRKEFEDEVDQEQRRRTKAGNGDGLTDFEVKGLLETLRQECRATRQLQKVGIYILKKQEYRNLSHDQLLAHIGFLARSYYQAIWAGCDTDEKVVLAQLAEERVVNPKTFDRIHDLMQKGLIVRDPDLRLMNDSFRRYVCRAVRRTQVLKWEQEGGPSAWSVLRWLLPLPLLLLGVFLFITQRDAVSNVQGAVVALGSVVPTLFNLYGYFQRQMSARRESASA